VSFPYPNKGRAGQRENPEQVHSFWTAKKREE
jgi:hypothetical protein